MHIYYALRRSQDARTRAMHVPARPDLACSAQIEMTEIER
jgi:hypothetical protein